MESHLRSLARDENLRVVAAKGTSDIEVLLETTKRGAARLQRLVALEDLDFVYTHSSLGTNLLHEVPTSFEALGVSGEQPGAGSSSGGSSDMTTVGTLVGIFVVVVVVAVVVAVYVYRTKAPSKRTTPPPPGSRRNPLSESREILITGVVSGSLPDETTTDDRDDDDNYIDIQFDHQPTRSEASLTLGNCSVTADC